MEPATLPAYQAFSVLEYSSTGDIQIYASLRDPNKGELKTQEFWEDAGDGRSMRAKKPVGWEHNLTAGLQPVGAAAGNLNDFYKTFWETWTDGSKFNALALTQEDPIAVTMEPGDRIIHTPILGVDQKCHVFFWRKKGAGHALYRHIFSGEVDHKGAVVTEKILEIPYEPLFTVADPIAIYLVKKKGFEERGLAVIGWLSSEGGNLRAHAVWIKGSEAKTFDSDPIAGYKPHSQQRIGLFAIATGSIQLAWLMGRADTDSFRVANWTIDVNQGTKSTRIFENAFTGMKIHSSACVYYRNWEENEGKCFLLTETGNLYEQRGQSKPRKLRSDVPLTYDFPIFASYFQHYEAKIKPDGTIFFDTP